MTDDQALSRVGPECMPTVTRLLAGQGTTLENAFLPPHPLFCRSGAGLLTGQYGHNNGVLTSSYGYLRDKGNVLPVWLPASRVLAAASSSSSTATTSAIGKRPWRRAGTSRTPELDASQGTYYDWDLSRNGHRSTTAAHRGPTRRAYSSAAPARLVRRFAPHRKPIFLEGSTRSLPTRASTGRGLDAAPYQILATSASSATRASLSRHRSTRPMSATSPGSSPPQRRLTDAEIHHPDGPLPVRSRLPYQEVIDPHGGAPLRRVQRSRRAPPGAVFIFVYTDNGVFFGEHWIRAQGSYAAAESDPARPLHPTPTAAAGAPD